MLLRLFSLQILQFLLVEASDVARPLSNKTKTIYFFKTKTGQVKTKTTFQYQDRFFFKDH